MKTLSRSMRMTAMTALIGLPQFPMPNHAVPDRENIGIFVTAPSAAEKMVVAEKFEGGSGNDTYEGSDDADTALGNSGADILKGAGNDDDLDGSSEDDQFDGGADWDTCIGGSGTKDGPVPGSNDGGKGKGCNDTTSIP